MVSVMPGFMEVTDKGPSHTGSTRRLCGLARLPSGSRRPLGTGCLQHQGHPAGSGPN